MHTASPQGWLSYAIPAVIIGIVLFFRLRNINRERPLKVERLWIIPTLYLFIAAVTFWNLPPHGMVWSYCGAALLAGAAIGWQRGKLMGITVNPETHELSQKASPWAMLLLLGLIVMRSAARNADSLGIPGVHVDVMMMTDVLIALALGLLTATRVEMYLRAQRLLAEAPRGMKRHAPATARNRDAIAEVLAAALPKRGVVLEIASGSGEHCAFFAERFPALDWQPSDPDAEALASIAEWTEDLANVRPPIALDAAADWPVAQADAILCINMVHISSWAATLGLMAGAGQLLAPGAPLILYGPYRQHDVPTAPSNEQFELWLKDKSPEFGLRYVEDVTREAAAQGLALERIIAMPANNLMVIYRHGA